jgi:tRNA(Ile2) C34 agmatinyltransferase TiaS
MITLEPQHDPYCGRCGGTAGPQGAWCNDCIRECKEYTRWLDLQRDMREAA